jgi:hypothetical protein
MFYFDCTKIGVAKSKLCNPFLIAVIVQGILFSIKLDHITSHVLHLNSPGATSGFIALFILLYRPRGISILSNHMR